MALRSVLVSFSFLVPVETEPYTLSLHAALPIWAGPSALWLGLPAQHRRHERLPRARRRARGSLSCRRCCRSEEHTSELQSRPHLVCRLLLAKKMPGMDRARLKATIRRAMRTKST